MSDEDSTPVKFLWKYCFEDELNFALGWLYLYILPTILFSLHPLPFQSSAVRECASRSSSIINVSLDTHETTNQCAGPNRCGTILNGANETSSMKRSYLLTGWKWCINIVNFSLICNKIVVPSSVPRETFFLGVAIAKSSAFSTYSFWTSLHGPIPIRRTARVFSEWFYIQTKYGRLENINRCRENHRKRNTSSQIYQSPKA